MLACSRISDVALASDPRHYLPYIVRGSLFNGVNQSIILTDNLKRLDAHPSIKRGIRATRGMHQ